ncbi:hypothetical protein QL285_020204 [Trifolium repens]|nr:hypothetical protein QL285_020204 [Trifolium repens]
MSFAGRVTLAKSVLEAIPIYPMMTNIIPKACIDEIHKIQRSFIWGDADQARKCHAVGWEMVTRPKPLGGLGLRGLSTMNKACILKLGRKIQSGANDFWCVVMLGKYKRGSNSGEVVAEVNDSHLWKPIVKVWPHLETHSLWLIGDGKTIDLCHDAWIEDGLRLEEYTWVTLHIKAKIAALLPPGSNMGDDQQVCKENAMGIFSISEMYHALCDFDMNSTASVWHHIWRLKVPGRVRAFILLVNHDRLLTNDRKNRMGLSTDMCDYCRNSKETTLHALRDCVLVRPVWLSLVDASRRHQFFSSNLHEWIATNVANKGSKNYYDDWSFVWVVACHQDVVVRHAYREANRLADALAKHSFTVNEEVCSFQVCPDFCKHQLDVDQKGLVTLKSVIA